MRVTKSGMVLGGLAIVVVLFAGCGGTSSHASTNQSNCATRAGAPSAIDTGSARATGRVIDVEARDFDFHPTCILDVPSGSVTLIVHNTGGQPHNVQIASQHIDRDVQPGATVRIPVRIGTTPVVFICKYHPGLGMAGALIPTSPPAKEGP